MDPNGYIVTNAHVVVGASKVQVRFAPPKDDGSGKRSILRPHGDLLGAQIVGLDRRDRPRGSESAETEPSHTTLWGTRMMWNKASWSSHMAVQEASKNSVSMGVVSATARQVQEEDPMIYIQTDAEINPATAAARS